MYGEKNLVIKTLNGHWLVIFPGSGPAVSACRSSVKLACVTLRKTELDTLEQTILDSLPLG